MLTWQTAKNRRSTIEAHLDGYTYTIMEGDDLDEWATQITDPNGAVQDYEVHNSIEEAKEYCERTAAETG
jgi:hypothetical protein